MIKLEKLKKVSETITLKKKRLFKRRVRNKKFDKDIIE